MCVPKTNASFVMPPFRYRVPGGLNVLRFLLLTTREDGKYRREVRERDIKWNLARLRAAIDAAEQDAKAASGEHDPALGRADGPLGLEILSEVLGRVEELVI